MDTETKLKNLDKLDSMLLFIGYPNELANGDVSWLEEMYKGLQIDPEGKHGRFVFFFICPETQRHVGCRCVRRKPTEAERLELPQ